MLVTKEAVVIIPYSSFSAVAKYLTNAFCNSPERATSMKEEVIRKATHVPHSSLGRTRTSNKNPPKPKRKIDPLSNKLNKPDFNQYDFSDMLSVAVFECFGILVFLCFSL